MISRRWKGGYRDLVSEASLGESTEGLCLVPGLVTAKAGSGRGGSERGRERSDRSSSSSFDATISLEDVFDER